MRELKTLVHEVQSLAPKARTASENGASIDMQGFDSCFAIVECGVITDGTHTPKLQESSDNTTFTDVAAADQIGTLAACTQNGTQRVAYIGALRYVRVVMTVAGATTGALSSAVLVQGHPSQAPTS